jgi:4-hydroxy-tetrahydrodipicolinate synthase
MSDLPRPLCGIVPPLVTPLSDYDTLDAAGLERLVEHVLAGGVHGLFLLGTTGEAPSLSYRLRRELVARVCRQVNGRVPVLVGVTDTAMVESLRMAAVAAEAGAAAVVLAPPPYFPVCQDDLRCYVQRIVEDLPLPLFLYNMPSHSKLVYQLETLRELFESPRIAGLKDSSGDMLYFHAVRKLTAGREDFSLLMGPEELLAEAVLLGGAGGVCGGANLRPRLYVDLYQAARTGDLETMRRLHDEALHLSQAVYRGDQNSAGVIKGIKCVLSRLGICRDVVAPPMHALEETQQEKIRRELPQLGIAVKGRPAASKSAVGRRSGHRRR